MVDGRWSTVEGRRSKIASGSIRHSSVGRNFPPPLKLRRDHAVARSAKAGSCAIIAVLLSVTALAAAPVPFTSIAKGLLSDQETPRPAVVRTPAQWHGLWNDHARGDKLPAVDFATTMVVGVFLGTKPTAGYGVEIVGMKTDGDTLVVEFTERQPGRGTMAAQILTQPFHLVSVAQHAGPVRFVAVTSIGDRQ